MTVRVFDPVFMLEAEGFSDGLSRTESASPEPCRGASTPTFSGLRSGLSLSEV